MDTEKTSNSMASSVLIVKTSFKERPSGQDVKIFSGKVHIVWPNNSFKVKISDQDSGVALLLERGWGFASEVATSSDICGSIEVLTSRIEEINLIWVHLQGSFL